MSVFPNLIPWDVLYNDDDVIFRVRRNNFYEGSHFDDDHTAEVTLTFEFVNLEARRQPSGQFKMTIDDWNKLKARVDDYISAAQQEAERENEERERENSKTRRSPPR